LPEEEIGHGKGDGERLGLIIAWWLDIAPSKPLGLTFASLNVINLPHDVELHAGFARKEETMEGREWQAQRIVGERQ
jgi:hypothetical protein